MMRIVTQKGKVQKQQRASTEWLWSCFSTNMAAENLKELYCSTVPGAPRPVFQFYFTAVTWRNNSSKHSVRGLCLVKCSPLYDEVKTQ